MTDDINPDPRKTERFMKALLAEARAEQAAEKAETKGLPVEGYRPTQSDENIELVNVNKRLEERVLRQLDLLETFSDVDKRWLAIARTDIEKGFVAANRAIFRPLRLDLNNDDL